MQEERGLGDGLSMPGIPNAVLYALVGLAAAVAIAQVAGKQSGPSSRESCTGPTPEERRVQAAAWAKRMDEAKAKLKQQKAS